MPKLPQMLRKPGKPGQGRHGARTNGAGNGAPPGAAEPEGLQLGDKVKEGAIDVVGWVDERTGASPFLTGLLLRKVPKGTNWFYTLGSATLFALDRKSTRLNSSHSQISYAVFCLKKKKHTFDGSGRMTTC